MIAGIALVRRIHVIPIVCPFSNCFFGLGSRINAHRVIGWNIWKFFPAKVYLIMDPRVFCPRTGSESGIFDSLGGHSFSRIYLDISGEDNVTRIGPITNSIKVVPVITNEVVPV